MLRPSNDDREKRDAIAKLERARDLMAEALSILDSKPVATDCDALLDHALHNLAEAIEQVHAGEPIFRRVAA